MIFHSDHPESEARVTDIEVPKSPHRKPTKAEATAALREKCVAQGNSLIQMRADQLADFLDEITRLRADRATREARIAKQEAKIARWNKDARKLAGGLLAIYNADPGIPADVLRGIAYDIALNCIDPETAKYQIVARTLAKQTTRAAPAEGGE